ncbi:hypothetical protein M9H77_17581 [Catharanthus roseus]|uniref:Uncharacterized protein n=1 Tax=Catharanthus roseus TaxID=4058 RepID=A0ACC0B4Z8_CATRO|nr:hypothetical protein M9H77_17581 [Catharanthus roseus]
MLGYKNEHKLLDICLRLDMMTADEVRWTPYRMQEIRDCWVSTWHGFIAYFYCVELYMPDRIAPSHLLTESWTSVPTVVPSSCTEDYMDWFLPRSHLRIQNPSNILRGFHVPIDPPMPAEALLDLVSSEASREDIGKEERLDRVLDLLRRHCCAP